MSSYAQILRGSAVVALAATLGGCGINSIPTAEENVKARWADVQNDYQRRADLIPNLVATVKAAGAQEKSILVEVTQARAAASTVLVSGDDLTDPAKIEQFSRVQGAVGRVLGHRTEPERAGGIACDAVHGDSTTNVQHEFQVQFLDAAYGG